MNLKIKTLGLALVAALALIAVAASTAQANFTSSAAHTTLSGSPTGGFVFGPGSGIGVMTCTTTFAGTLAGTSASTVTVKPTYGPTCTDSLGRVVHVTQNTLEYHLLSTASKGKVTVTGHLELTVTTAFGHCTITTQGDQTFNGVSYAQQGNDLLITFSTNNITSTVAGGPFPCGADVKHPTNGTLTGSILLKGNSGAAKISVH